MVLGINTNKKREFKSAFKVVTVDDIKIFLKKVSEKFGIGV